MIQDGRTAEGQAALARASVGSTRVLIEIGPSGDEQESDFQNGTTQEWRGVDYTIQTYIDPPLGIEQTPEGVARYLDDVLGDLAHQYPNLSFDVQVGPPHAR